MTTDIPPMLPCKRSNTNVFTVHLGPFRDFRFLLFDPTVPQCFGYRSLFVVMFVVLGISTVLHCFSVFVIAKCSLWEQRKFLQLFLLNVTNILFAFSLTFFIASRTSFHLEQLMCVLGYHLFFWGMGLTWMALLGLSTDCVVAVYRPLKFRSIMTTSQFFKFNGTFLAINAIVTLTPIPFFGSQNDGILLLVCDYSLISPKYYLLILACFSFFLILSLFLLNVSTGIGVLFALIKQQKLKAEGNNSTVRKMLKLTFRLMSVILITLICNLPLNLLALGIKVIPTEEAAFLFAFTTGLWHILMYVAADHDFRVNALSIFKCS